MNTPRSRTELTGQTSAPATENEQLGSCDSLRVDEHHITSVLSALSWRRFERIHLEMLSTVATIDMGRKEAGGVLFPFRGKSRVPV